jgi:D-aminopeptidase
VGRARDLGIVIGTLPTGRWNAITDVAGVRVGHTTLIRGEGPLVVGTGPVRTGVTVVVPHDGNVWAEPLFAGCHTLNGNGELTGLEWIRESGHLYGAIGITNTHSVGLVRDALVDHAVRNRRPGAPSWSLTVAGECYDGRLNDLNGHHVRPQHVDAAIAAAASGPVEEGGVGGGTGMICHEFKGGIGTASRVVPESAGGWTVGVLIQANYGRRGLLTIDGVPVGREIPTSEVASPYDVPKLAPGEPEAGSGSSIVVVATDAPLLPNQCDRLAQRVGLGLARSGGYGATSSGDLFLCFATGNRGLAPAEVSPAGATFETVRALIDAALDPLIEATIEATEEAIANALIAATTMVGRDGITAHALPHDRLVEVMVSYNRRHSA